MSSRNKSAKTGSRSVSKVAADSTGISTRQSRATTDSRKSLSATPNAGFNLRSRKRRHRLRLHHVLVLLDRVLVLAAAMFCIVSSICAVVTSGKLLGGIQKPPAPYLDYRTDLMAKAAGNTTIAQSPLVQTILGGDTTPRQGTLYLDANDYVSFASCASTSAVDNIYEDHFQREMYDAWVAGAAYNITYLSNVELVVPIVDCQTGAIRFNDSRYAKFFYLVRDRRPPHKVFVISAPVFNQGYSIGTRDERGSTTFGTLLLVDRLNETKLNRTYIISPGSPWDPYDFRACYKLGEDAKFSMMMRIIPKDRTERFKTVSTATKNGFFARSESDQSNVMLLYTRLATNAFVSLSLRSWWASPAWQDSWAWAHFVHILLAWDVLYTAIVLFIIAFHNIRVGRFWLGDAFVAISTSLVFRSVIIIASWILNRSWALMEFCLYDAARLSSAPDYAIPEEIMHADLLTIYMSLVGILGKMVKERINPAMTVVLFQIGFSCRLTILQWFPALLSTMHATSIEDFNAGTIIADDEDIDTASPMNLWNTHPIIPRRPALIASTLFPIFSTMLIIVVYIAGCKIYRRFFTSKQNKYAIPQDGEANASPLLKHLRTQFEIATGAQLASQFGLICDYKNYIHIKGLQYASPDGIYSNGFVIVNRKFLVQARDLPAIILMNLLRFRYRNIFAFEIDQFRVSDTARLLFPGTISFRDLINLNLSVLA